MTTETEALTARAIFDRVLQMAVGSAVDRTVARTALEETASKLSSAERMISDFESTIALRDAQIAGLHDHLEELRQQLNASKRRADLAEHRVGEARDAMAKYAAHAADLVASKKKARRR